MHVFLFQVTEYAPLKSLLECLHNESLRLVLSVNRLCAYAHQIATGMTYLETQGLIHRDLAARNILVFSHHKASCYQLCVLLRLCITETVRRPERGLPVPPPPSPTLSAITTDGYDVLTFKHVLYSI